MLSKIFKPRSKDLIDSKKGELSNSNFLNAINLFKNKRNKMGYSIEELSINTKISKNVLLAIENGWENYLPEETYLITMIKRLEIELDLETNSLDGLLIKKVKKIETRRFKFRFINMDFLNTWTGNLIYIILMLLSLLALNSQQKYLIKINSQSTEPISIFPINDINKKPIETKKTK